jgi:hypothetical protein
MKSRFKTRTGRTPNPSAMVKIKKAKGEFFFEHKEIR